MQLQIAKFKMERRDHRNTEIPTHRIQISKSPFLRVYDYKFKIYI